MRGNLNSLLFGFQLKTGTDLFQQRIQIDFHEIEWGAMLLYLGKFKEIIDHPLHLHGFFVGDVVVLQNVLLTVILFVFD